MNGRLTAFFLFLFFSYSNEIFGQSDVEDSHSNQAALVNTISVYYNQSGDQSKLLNGSLYPEYPYSFREGTPYFVANQFSIGQVEYDGLLFDSVDLIYDDLRQFLVSRDNVLKVRLVNERVASFKILGHYFIRLAADNNNPGISKTGYYDVLYPGNSQVLKFTRKKIREVLTLEEGVIRYIDRDEQYYIKIKNSFIEVRSKDLLLDLFDNHRNEVQKFLKKNKLNFKKNKENTIIQAADFYDQLMR